MEVVGVVLGRGDRLVGVILGGGGGLVGVIEVMLGGGGGVNVGLGDGFVFSSNKSALSYNIFE